MKTQSVTLIRNRLGYLWAEMGKQYKTLRGAKVGITHDAKQLARRGVRVYTVLTIIDHFEETHHASTHPTYRHLQRPRV